MNWRIVMVRVFDPNEIIVKKLRDADCKIIKLQLDEKYLTMPFSQSFYKLNTMLAEKVANIAIEDNVYIKIELMFNASKEDVEIIYDAIEMIVTGLLNSPEQRTDREQRLGNYSIPNNINMKITHILKWINCIPLCSGIGWEVQKFGGFWKKKVIS
jgi:hypothetical protein